jgi:hypothetical protein
MTMNINRAHRLSRSVQVLESICPEIAIVFSLILWSTQEQVSSLKRESKEEQANPASCPPALVMLPLLNIRRELL